MPTALDNLSEAKAVCDPIMASLRERPEGREIPAPTLDHWMSVLGGWLHTLGEASGEMYSEAEQAQAEADSKWGAALNSYLAAGKSATGAEKLADADPDYHDANRNAARARGAARILTNYHKDVHESIQVMKKIQDSQFKVKGVG